MTPPLTVTDRSSLPTLGETLDFLRLIWAVDHALLRTSRKMEMTLGVTGQQRLVVRIVGRFPGLPAGQLARLLHLHPSTLTGVLQRLDRLGLVKGTTDPKDRRRLLLQLTAKGRAFDIATEGTAEAAVERALEGATPQQVQGARAVLGRISEALEHEAAGRAAPPGGRAKSSAAASPRASGRSRGR
jgi:DNA-binding MarR family transcriptional regulator